MRTASRPSFTRSEAPQEKQNRSALFGEALGTLFFISLMLGSLVWATGNILVENDLIRRNLPWWAFVRLAAALHLIRAFIMLPRKN